MAPFLKVTYALLITDDPLDSELFLSHNVCALHELYYATKFGYLRVGRGPWLVSVQGPWS